MSLHITCVDGLGCRIKNYWHLEEEHVVWCDWGTAHFVAHAVKVIAIAEEFTTEAAEDKNVLSV